jgi:hypothetical protein
MPKDYYELFKQVIAPHLHKLVDMVSGEAWQRVLAHEWVLGIEKNWATYVNISEEGSEFIPRLSFRIGGMRKEFEEGLTKEEVIKRLIESLDISTFCFFEFGTESKIADQIDKYCKEVDKWMKEDILSKKFDKFMFSKKAIPIIYEYTEIIKTYYPRPKSSKLEVKKDIDNATDLEKNLKKIFLEIVKQLIKIKKDFPDCYKSINKNILDFEQNCDEIGYKNLIPKKIKEEVKNIDELISIKESLSEVLNEINKYYDTTNLDFPLMRKIDTSKEPKEVKGEIIKQLSSFLIKVISQKPELLEGIDIIKSSAKGLTENLLSKEQEKKIDEMKKYIHIRKLLLDTQDIIGAYHNFDERIFPLINKIDTSKKLNDVIKHATKTIPEIVIKELKEYKKSKSEVKKDISTLKNIWKGVTSNLFNEEQEQEIKNIKEPSLDIIKWFKKIPWKTIISFIIILIILSSLLVLFDKYKDKEPSNVEEIVEVIEYPSLDVSVLTEQQVIKAKSMTPEAQMKEFGGVLK